MLRMAIGLVAVSCALCVSAGDIQQSQPVAGEANSASSSDQDDADQLNLLKDGVRLINEKKPAEAITGAFDKVIAHFESKYRNSEKQIYCARSMQETILYLGMALSDKRDAKVLDATWAEAYRLKGYALVEIGQVPEARASIERAVTLSPWGAPYQLELGYTYQVEKNWKMSLEVYRAAASRAEFSPETVKDADRAKALHGQGFALTELGRLDEAESKYRESMELVSDDDLAKREIKYILELKEKRAH